MFVKGWEQKDELGNIINDSNGKAITRTGYEIIRSTEQNTIAFITGNVVAFIVAMFAIRFFINYLKVYGFRVFGVYRILAGVILLILLLTGVIEG